MSAARLRPTLELPVHGARLRPWQLSDAQALSTHGNSRAIWLNLRDRFPNPYTLTDAEHHLRFVLSPEGMTDVHLCIEVDGEAAGSISVLFKQDVNRRSAEIGYFLGQQFWGRGITTAAVVALTDYAFTNFDLCRLYAVVFAPNAASARVLEKAGYELEARLRKSITKDGQTMDSLLYASVK
ncbi:GNAT family N-acetyltransferase [Hymenobacter radiodurans]|uniref:GNAT family N-acetyltransferase n=1 Tax=Hymenobacter radiodurans TaxID=2496028 RepID=UPI001058EA60|nr:GNAT family protein [Hymenobacter radiodurans]